MQIENCFVFWRDIIIKLRFYSAHNANKSFFYIVGALS
jgi:hypothetical protein